MYKDFLVDYHRAEEDGYKKRKLVITRTTQEQQDILLFALSGVLFAGLNNAVAYQNTKNDKYQACPFVNVLIPLQVVFPEKENNV